MKEDELKELFLAEALESYELLNQYFVQLEKDKHQQKAIQEIFRITHTLKANAAGMGFEDIAAMAHVMEDVFGEIKTGRLLLDDKIFTDLFKANDILGAMLQQIRNPDKMPKVSFKGLKTKLEVLLRTLRGGQLPPPTPATPETNAIPQTSSSDTTPISEITEITESLAPIESAENASTTYFETEKANEEATTLQTEGTSVSAEDTDETPDETEKTDDTKIVFSDLVHIPVKKLDNLMNLVGELIIERDRMITTISGIAGVRKNEFARLQRISSDLQYSVMDIRLVQVSVLFHKFHRIVRDTAALENKKVNLILEGTDIEIDRNILQIISDSLVHLVRNAISHGIEDAETRKQQGKSEVGTLKLTASNEKDTIIIAVKDDGKGIDANVIGKKAVEKGIIPAELLPTLSEEDLIQLIFEPGFSSADKVTSVSGRGVGTDVVKRSVEKIGGKVLVHTEVGKGTTFELVLPSSMALKPALLCEDESITFAIPLTYTDAVQQIPKEQIHQLGKSLVTTYQNKTIGLMFLKDFFASETERDLSTSFLKLTANTKINAILVSYGNKTLAIAVDRLLQQKEIVEKNLSKPLDQEKYFSGATILGNGEVCLVLDIPSIMNTVYKSGKNTTQRKHL